MQLLGDAADNPDQRIAEDVKQFIDAGATGIGILPIGLSLLNATVTLASFAVILWNLSAAAPLHVFGISIDIPGYLLWAALIYAILGTTFTHLIGRALIALNFQQQRYEADFRFNLVRVRENSEQIALLNGERAERDRLLLRFANVVSNWMAIMSRQKKLTFLTAGYSQAAVVFPYIMVSPAYFAGKVQLGGLMQTANAFGQVQGALSVFVNVYRQLAEWRAVVDRLSGFDQSIEAARAAAVTPPVIAVAPADANAVSFKDLSVRLPNGVPLINATDVTIKLGERVLVSGPSGAGKSTLFRALAGVWPFGDGTISIPEKRAHDDAAAAALFSNRTSRCRRGVSGPVRTVRCREGRRTHQRRRPACLGAAHRGGSALEPDAVTGRAATARHRARTSLPPRFPVPR